MTFIFGLDGRPRLLSLWPLTTSHLLLGLLALLRLLSEIDLFRVEVVVMAVLVVRVGPAPPTLILLSKCDRKSTCRSRRLGYRVQFQAKVFLFLFYI